MRLTNAHRSQIVRELTKDYLMKELTVALREQAKLARDVYEHVLGEDYKRIKRLPAEWFPSRSFVRVRIDGHYESLSFSATPKDKTVRLPMPQYLVGSVPTIPVNYELSKRHRALNSTVARIRLERGTLDNDIRSILDERTTVATLVKAWPEIENTVRNVTRGLPATCHKTRPRKSPTTNLTAMNSILGLKHVVT